MRRPTVLLAAALAMAALGSAMAGEPAAIPAATTLRPLDHLLARLPIPAGYVRVRTSDVSIDRQAARLIRYERADDRNSDLGGEHVSVLVDHAGRLKGFARMDLALRDRALPSAEEAEAIARDFLAGHAPDLARATLIVGRIAPHEQMLTADDETVTLTGMKVKMRNEADGRWLWVTVGPDREVMAFERDVVWLGPEGGRQGEQWLSDGWLGRAVERLQERGA